MLHEIFVCYARENRNWVEELHLHKRPSTTEPANIYVDTNHIYVGDNWHQKIEQLLSRMTAAILLVSNDFIDSDSVKFELELILPRYKIGEMTLIVIPIGEALDIPRAHELLTIDTSVVSIPSWEQRLPSNPIPRPDIRSEILSRATEPREVQLLRRNMAAPYELTEKLGDGPFSTVYRGFDKQLKRDVAIKVLRDSNRAEVFQKTVRHISKVSDHTNILSIYSAFFDSYPPHYIFQYIDGIPLYKLLRHGCNEILPNYDGGPLPIRYVREFLTSIGDAVRYAHEKQDEISDINIKPSNIIVSAPRRGHARAYYIHLTKYPEKEFLIKEDWRMHRDDILYLPIEYRKQFKKTARWSDPKKADQYRLGIIAYEMLVGPERFRSIGSELRKPDFASDDWQWPPIGDEREDCPKRVCDVVDKMVTADVDDRYESVERAVSCVKTVDPDVEIVRESYRRLMDTEESQNEFFRIFYLNFIRRFADAKEKFGVEAGFEDLKEAGEIPRRWKMQFQALKEAVLLLIVFSAFGEADREINILTRIVESHVRREVPAWLYRYFGDVLVEVAAEKDEHAPIELKELRRAWENVIRPGINHMALETGEILARGG